MEITASGINKFKCCMPHSYRIARRQVYLFALFETFSIVKSAVGATRIRQAMQENCICAHYYLYFCMIFTHVGIGGRQLNTAF